MDSLRVISPALLLGILLYHGICVNGKTYATPNEDECENPTDEYCQNTYTASTEKTKTKVKLSNENQLLEEIKKKKGDYNKYEKGKLVNSFIGSLTGKGQKKAKLHDINLFHDKTKGSSSSLGNTEDEEDQIYIDLWNNAKNAQGCVHNHVGNNGIIHFSNANLSGNWSRCIWTIDTNGSHFKIEFENFSMSSCQRVAVGDGISLLPIAIFHGDSTIGSVRLPHVSAYILFTSDCQNKSAEFTLHWNTVESGCNGQFFNDYGMMHYPVRSYNGSQIIQSSYTYNNNEHCTWVIISSKPLHLRFTRFSTEKCCDFLYVRDGNTSKSDLLAMIHGDIGMPRSINTSTNSVHLLFTSDNSTVGPGFTMRWNIVEPCGGIYSTESGTIRHPTIPGNIYRNNQNCTWIIKSNVSLQIVFYSFNTEGCCDYLSVRDGSRIGTPLLGRFSGNRLPTTLRTKREAYIQFNSDEKNAKTGFVLRWNINSVGDHIECGDNFNADNGIIQYPLKENSNYPHNANCSWVIVTSGANIELNFTRFSTEKCCDFVYIKDGKTSSDHLIGRYRGNTLPSTVRTTTNKAFIRFTSDMSGSSTGFALTWNKVGCGAVYNNDTGMIRYPETDGYYHNNENCTWIISASYPIIIKFISFNTEQGYDILHIRDGEHISSPVIRRLSGNGVPSLVRTITNAVHLRFISDRGITRTGFVLQWDSTACAEHYNTNSGVIHHPLSGRHYRNNEDCTWIIRASYPINITLVSFDTEARFDHLNIRDGDTIDSPLLGSYSGSNFPRTIQTSTNEAHLQFTSDGSSNRAGFELNWNAPECGYYYRNDSGEIRLPLHEDEYENNQHCVWIIETTGHFIDLSFENFNTEPHYDTLIIRDGDNSGSPLVGTYSGKVHTSVRMATRKAYLKFTSDASIVRAGFVLRWNTSVAEGNSKCSCGSVNNYQNIAGGEDVEYKVQYPWHVGLFSQKNPSFYFCGGTLISDKYVLTAAHCLFPKYPDDLMIRIGDHIQGNTTEDIEGITEAISVEKVYINPGYNKRTKNNDFALLQLSRSITLTDDFGIRPICLPHSSYHNYTGEQSIAIGWGNLNQQSSRLVPDTLQQVEMTILPPECNDLSQITPAMLCAYAEGKDTCHGDAGGSLAVVENGSNEVVHGSDSSNNGTEGHYVLVGVTSWGIGCATRTPGVYSRVTTVLNWIKRFALTCERRGAA